MTFCFLKFDVAKLALPLPAFARVSKDGRMISESRTGRYPKLRRGLASKFLKGGIKGRF
jgi:hypothetical protein